MSLSDPASRRSDYARAGLTEAELRSDPVEQFLAWLHEAEEAGLPEPNAMTLATASSGGMPSARIVLLRGCDQRGFVFYTNYESRKGRELSANPHVSLVFYWPQLERQVRVEGTAVRVAAEESDAYFQSRPRASQIGAIASRQSSQLADRSELTERVRRLTERFDGKPIPRPEYWGGIRVIPTALEFWQGRPSRLHDRLAFLRNGDAWRVARLSP